MLLLSNPPLAGPRLLRAAVRAAGGVMARRLVHRYRRANPSADLTNLDWYRALHSARILLEHARLEATTGSQVGHPFGALVGPATAALGAVTGARLLPGG